MAIKHGTRNAFFKIVLWQSQRSRGKAEHKMNNGTYNAYSVKENFVQFVYVAMKCRHIFILLLIFALNQISSLTAQALNLTIEPIDIPGAIYTEVWGINKSSVKVGTFYNPMRGFLLDAEGNFTSLTVMGTDTDAFGLNDRGNIVGIFYGLSEAHGYKLDAALNLTIIDVPGASGTQPHDINNSGIIVGFFESPTGVHGFMRDIAGNYSILDPPGATGGGFTGTFANGINDNGEIVGNFQNISGVHGFLRDAAGNYMALDVPGDNVTEAFGINNHGEIVGFFFNKVGGIPSGVHGFLRDTAGNYIVLDVPGVSETRLLDINDEGKIVGRCTDASGKTQSFLASAPRLPPIISKFFSVNNVELNGTVFVVFNISNPNIDANLTGIAFTDSLPDGLMVASPNNLVNDCGGTVTAIANTSSISLDAGILPASTLCSISLSLKAIGAGVQMNTTGAITSNESGLGAISNTVFVTVVVPPTLDKAFGASRIPLNGSTSLTFKINNPNTNIMLTGIAFTDNLPAGLVVTNPSRLSSTCGGTATAVSGSGSVSLSEATIATNGNCTLTVNVTGVEIGVKNNTTEPVTSTNGGTGNTASALVTVEAAVAIPTLKEWGVILLVIFIGFNAFYHLRGLSRTIN
jgi:hypothetical protein